MEGICKIGFCTLLKLQYLKEYWDRIMRKFCKAVWEFIFQNSLHTAFEPSVFVTFIFYLIFFFDFDIWNVWKIKIKGLKSSEVLKSNIFRVWAWHIGCICIKISGRYLLDHLTTTSRHGWLLQFGFFSLFHWGRAVQLCETLEHFHGESWYLGSDLTPLLDLVDEQVWPLTQFFPFCKKIIDLPGGLKSDP